MVIGVLVIIAIALVSAYSTYWWYYQDDKQTMLASVAKRERSRLTMLGLSDDMEFLKAKVSALIDHTGLPDDEDDDEEQVVKKKIEEDDEVEV